MHHARRLSFLVAATVVLVPGIAEAERSTDLGPYKTFHFTFTSRTPDAATGFRYRVEQKDVGGGDQQPPASRLDLTFAKGTRIDLGAVTTCAADDAAIMQGGAGTCGAKTLIATGEADLYLGTTTPLTTKVVVAVTGRRKIVVVLSNAGKVLKLLRGSLAGRTLSVPVPQVKLSGGKTVALTRFSLDIRGGTKAKPVFRTPKSCTKAGWDVTYAPTFTDLGPVSLVDTTHCKR